jgi:hypothetical protein
MPPRTYRALSLKQPWAALLVAGRKTVEVRRWSTSYRGRLLIHAARIPDTRREAWRHVSPDLDELARLEGGIIGIGTLTACKAYHGADDFDLDRALHLNEPSWFEPAGLFGFCFEALGPLPYHQVPGNVRLFQVELDLDLGEAAGQGQQADANGRTSPGAVWQRFRRLVRSLGPPRRPEGPSGP